MTRNLSLPLSLIGGAAALLLAPTATAQISYAPGVGYTTAGQEPSGCALLDVNGDGALDIAVATDQPDRIEVFMNTGAGTFGAPVPTFLGNGTSPHSLVARDFDLDGDTDLAVSLKNTNQVQLVINNGGFLTAGPTTAAGGLEPRRMEAADIDGDGDMDLAAANRDSDNVSVFRNTGGAFTLIGTLSAGQEPRDVTFGDFDGDGDTDMAASGHDSRTVHLFINGGTGNFTPGATLSVGAQLRPTGLTNADLDGDGDRDIATATSGNGLNFVSVFLNTGGGVFVGPTNFASGGLNPDDVLAADFDVDGDIDLATTNEDSNSIGLLANSGAATFAAPVVMATGVRPGDIAACDLDGNGSTDLVTSNRDSNNVSVFRNQGANPVSYCVGAANSAGPGALMGHQGNPDISANNFAVTVSGAPANVSGLFFFGSNGTESPFGNGFRCVGGQTFRLPFSFTDGTGSAIRMVDFTTAPGSVIAPCSTWHFQYWYRDQVGSGFNLSNGLRVVFGL